MVVSAQPNLIHSILSVIFYLIIAVFVIYSVLALYALMRFGRNRIITATIALAYLIISAGLYAAAATNLNNIKF